MSRIKIDKYFLSEGFYSYFHTNYNVIRKPHDTDIPIIHDLSNKICLHRYNSLPSQANSSFKFPCVVSP